MPIYNLCTCVRCVSKTDGRTGIGYKQTNKEQILINAKLQIGKRGK
jgi:hypothetical protein